jgi:hypothetical protein
MFLQAGQLLTFGVVNDDDDDDDDNNNNNLCSVIPGN